MNVFQTFVSSLILIVSGVGCDGQSVHLISDEYTQGAKQPDGSEAGRKIPVTNHDPDISQDMKLGYLSVFEDMRWDYVREQLNYDTIRHTKNLYDWVEYDRSLPLDSSLRSYRYITLGWLLDQYREGKIDSRDEHLKRTLDEDRRSYESRLLATKKWLTEVLGAPTDLAWYAWLDPDGGPQSSDSNAAKAWKLDEAARSDARYEQEYRALRMAMDEWRWCKFFGTVVEYGKIKHPGAWKEHKGEFDQLCSDADQILTDVEAMVSAATSGKRHPTEDVVALLMQRIQGQRDSRRQLTLLFLEKIAGAPGAVSHTDRIKEIIWPGPEGLE